MAITVATIQTELNSILGDSSTDRISANDRLQAITEATVWLQEETLSDLQNATYTLNYYDSVYDYKVTSAIADLLDGADLRRGTDDQTLSFTHKSARELAEEIGQRFGESSWAIERRDSNAYLKINHSSKYNAKVISGFDSTTDGGGTWSLDTTNGDGTNLTVDTVEFKQGSGSLNFDADVSQSGNNKIEIGNTTLSSQDLGDDEDLASWLFWAYIPDVTNFTSFTLYWGSDTSNYWSATVTTDIDGAAWVDGWNRVKIDWADATKTSSPDVTAITYVQIDLNYGAGQGDDSDFRLDELILVKPEKLTYHYISWYVGTNTGGTDITAFTATTDVPYFSGQYDNLKFAVAHKAASKIFNDLRLGDESDRQMREAQLALRRVIKIFPSSRTPEVKSFKVRGVNLNKRRR